MLDVTGGPERAPMAGYGVREVAGLLGVGVTAVRRRIVAGRVHLDGRPPLAKPPGSPDREASGRLPRPPTSFAETEALAPLIRATVTPIVAPLVAELAASRRSVERQAERIAELEREYGRLSAQFQTAVADAIAARTQVTALTAELERSHADRWTGPAEPPPAPILAATMSPGLQRWLRWAARGLVIAIVVAALVLLLFVLPPLDTFM